MLPSMVSYTAPPPERPDDDEDVDDVDVGVSPLLASPLVALLVFIL
jgi:hypothetical protein